ncbi:MAG: hypothetical protein H0U73_12510 [Tatlockia sp.]|nr:hypothetical protein [Tatlockia sp.]
MQTRTEPKIELDNIYVEKYNEYMNNFKTLKETLEKKLNPPSRKLPFHFYEKVIKIKKLQTMDAFLVHLEKYDATTRSLIENNQENAAFYCRHYEAVATFLEKIAKKELTELYPEDFVLVVPQSEPYKTQSEPYKKSFSEKCNDLLLFSMQYADVGVVIMAVVGAIAAGLICGILVLVLAGPFSVLDAFAFFSITTVFCGYLGSIAGGLIGGAVGFLVGALVGAFVEIPTTNRYVNGRAFDCELLKDAYIEASEKTLKGANNVVENESTVIQPSF